MHNCRVLGDGFLEVVMSIKTSYRPLFSKLKRNYRAFTVLLTTGTCLNSILYLQRGHLFSKVILGSNKNPHSAHLYNYKPPIILLIFLLAVLPIGVAGTYAPPVKTLSHLVHLQIPLPILLT